MKMSEKQKKFADYYIESNNATESAVKAGYSTKYTNTNVTKLLQNTTIKEYIQEKLEEMASERIASATEVLEFITKAVRGEILEDVVVTEGEGDGYSSARIVKKQIAAKDRVKAAELLGKRYMLFTDKVNITGAVPVMIVGEDTLEK